MTFRLSLVKFFHFRPAYSLILFIRFTWARPTEKRITFLNMKLIKSNTLKLRSIILQVKARVSMIIKVFHIYAFNGETIG